MILNEMQDDRTVRVVEKKQENLQLGGVMLRN